MNITGKILWQDLTVENAEEVRNFYCAVLGWSFENVDMGGYNDYKIMNPDDSNRVVAGICHKKGENQNMPSQWLNYVSVKNLQISINKCYDLGGSVVEGPRFLGKSKFAVIKDPSGAVFALMEEEE